MTVAAGRPLSVVMQPKIGRVSARDVLCRNPVGNGSAAVLRKAVLDQAAFMHPTIVGRRCWFDEEFRQSEDIELWTRLAVKHKVTFAGIEGLLTDYRILSGALSANVVKQYLSWTKMLRKLRGYAPEFATAHGDTARAYQLRYLARRALQLGNFDLAKNLFSKAMGLKPIILVEEPRKTTMTAAAVLLASMLGRKRFSSLMRPFLRDAV